MSKKLLKIQLILILIAGLTCLVLIYIYTNSNKIITSPKFPPSIPSIPQETPNTSNKTEPTNNIPNTEKIIDKITEPQNTLDKTNNTKDEPQKTPEKKPITNTKNIWVNKDPIQCLGNPWEFDWLKKNKGKYNEYPIGDRKKIDTEEIIIIKDFFSNLGVNIFDIKSEITHEITCSACSCPQGHTLYVLVSPVDAEKMVEFGWKK